MKKTIEEILKEKNKAFKKMSATKKRVAIAKDVLAIMRTNKKVKIKDGGYYLDRNTSEVNNKPADQVIQEKKFDCQVCAKGAMMLAHVWNTDRKTVGDLIWHNGDASICELVDYFSRNQLDLIEVAFERDGFYTMNKRLGLRAEKFGELYKSDPERLKAIMNNIIKNNGTFKP